MLKLFYLKNVSAIPQILHELYNREIQSVVIEGGAATLKVLLLKIFGMKLIFMRHR